MLHRGTGFPVRLLLRQEWLVELYSPLGNVHVIAVHFKQRLDGMGTAVRSQAHHLAALVPVRKNIDRDPAVQRSETGHEIKLVAQETANRFEPDLFQGFNSGAVEFVIAFRLASERIDVVGQLTWFGHVGTVIAHSVHHHHDPFIEGAGGKSAVCVRQMMRYRHHLV